MIVTAAPRELCDHHAGVHAQPIGRDGQRTVLFAHRAGVFITLPLPAGGFRMTIVYDEPCTE